jgi:hypothetical protein
MAFAPPEILFDDLLEFLVSRPTPQEIVGYQVSDALNTRFHQLLRDNSHDCITADEQAELARFLQIHHLLIMLKARARTKLNSAS